MKSGHCPTCGEFVVTTVARLHIPNQSLRKPKEILMPSIPIDVPADTLLMPLRLVRAAFDKTEQIAADTTGHPKGLFECAVPAEMVRGLQIVVLRMPRRQGDLIEPQSLSDAAKLESRDARAALELGHTLARRAHAGDLAAEELLAGFEGFSNPALARTAYASIGDTGVELFDDSGQLNDCSMKAAPKLLASPQPHKILVRVTRVDKDLRRAGFKVTSVLIRDDLLHRLKPGALLETRLPDEEDLRDLSLCMVYDLQVEVEVSVTVKVHRKGVDYLAALIRIVDQQSVRERIRNGFTAETASMF